jgi:hypothetical protein
VLALETLRGLRAEEGAALLREEARALHAAVTDPRLGRAADAAAASLEHAVARAAVGGEAAEAGARRIALAIGHALEVLLLAAHAQWALDTESDPHPAAAALRLAAERVPGREAEPGDEAPTESPGSRPPR